MDALVWTIPLVAIVVSLALLLGYMRRLEDLTTAVADELRRFNQVRRPLVDLRRELARSGPLVDKVRSHWPPEDQGAP